MTDISTLISSYEDPKGATYQVSNFERGTVSKTIQTERGPKDVQMTLGKVLQMMAKDEPRARELLDLYNRDMGARKASVSTNTPVIVISKHPVDIGNMSTDRGWESCMILPNAEDIHGGANHRFIKCDVGQGTLIAYYLEQRGDLKSLKNATGRLLIKPYYQQDTGDLLMVSGKVYGEAPQSFKDFINTLIRWSNLYKVPGFYVIDKSLYADKINRVAIGTNYSFKEFYKTKKNKDFSNMDLTVYEDFSELDLSNANFTNCNLKGAILSLTNLSGANFTGANLSRAVLGQANLNRTIFHNTILNGALLNGVDLSGAIFKEVSLEGTFLNDANLTGVRLTGSSLKGAYLEEAKLTGADLSGVDLTDARCPGVDFNGANLSGATLYGADLSYQDFRNINLFKFKPSNAILIGANFSGLNLSKVNFNKAALFGANFSKANLSSANLVQADLEEADLSEANLSNARLFRARLLNVNLNNARMENAMLRQAQLDRANLVGVNLHNAVLAQVSFTEARMERADLSNTKLHNSGMYRANLKRANLNGADLGYCWMEQDNLTSVNVKAADLSRVQRLGSCEGLDTLIWDKRTKWPPNFNIEDYQ